MITNMQSPNGNAVANQFVIHTDNGMYFQSYNTLIAFKPNSGDTPTVTNAWDYSATTLRYLKQFLGTRESKKELSKRMESGSIILDDSLTVK